MSSSEGVSGRPIRPLADRRALVTGASRGIGRATAISLAAAGARVAVVSSRSSEDLASCAAEIRAAGGEALDLVADVADPDFVLALFKRIKDTWDGVDILVNNAGITRDGLAMMMPIDAWDEVIRVNLRSAFLCSRQAMRSMISGKWGRIINVISPAALLGKEGASNYAAAKGGMLSFSKSLAREVGRYGITVNAVCPGFIDTKMIEGMPQEQRHRFEEQIALGRFGQPEEVAHAIRFLAGPEAAYVTGSVLTVDGGLIG